MNLEIPGDPSSAAPFILLALLTVKSKLVIKNVNCNPTRIGFIKILKKMKANIKIKNLKKKSGEIVGDISVKSSRLKPINCPKKLVPFAIDEFPLLFVIAALLRGKSKFSGTPLSDAFAPVVPSIEAAPRCIFPLYLFFNLDSASIITEGFIGKS